MTRKCVLLVALVVFLSAAAAASGTDGASKDPSFRQMQITNVILKTGLRARIQDNRMFIIGSDGKQSPAKDGTYELMDGRKITVRNGAIIDVNRSLIETN